MSLTRRREASRSAQFAAVKEPQDDDNLAVVAVLDRIHPAEHGKDKFPVGAALSDRAPHLRMPPEQLGPRTQLARDACGDRRITLVKEGGKPLKILQRIN